MSKHDSSAGGMGETEAQRREAARQLGQARTPAKAAAARENGRKGGSRPDDFTDERRRRMSAGMRAYWERRRAEGRTINAGATRTGPVPKPLSEFPCTCTGGSSNQAADHKSACPRGRAIRRRIEKGKPLA